MSGVHSERKLDTLAIRDVRHLCLLLGTSEAELESMCSGIHKHPSKFYRRGIVLKKGKRRPTSTPIGRFRVIIDRLNGLLQRLVFPDSMHGGLRGRTTRTYAEAHVRKRAILKSDLENCFPNVRPKMVYDAFVEKLDCSPNVARYLTKLVTFDHQLPQGSPTSTVVANIVSRRMVRRLEGLAKTVRGEVGTFVDDIALSGPPYIGEFERTVKKIIRQEGFKPNLIKTNTLYRYGEPVIAGIRVNNGFDAPSEKIRKVRNQIDRLSANVTAGKSIDSQILASIEGQIRYIGEFNRGAANSLWKRLRTTRSAPSRSPELVGSIPNP